MKYVSIDSTLIYINMKSEGLIVRQCNVATCAHYIQCSDTATDCSAAIILPEVVWFWDSGQSFCCETTAKQNLHILLS